MEFLINIPEELLTLLIGTALSICFSAIVIVPVILWRIIRRKPIIPKREKLESPKLLYLGVSLTGGFSLFSFFVHMPFFGSAFLIFAGAFLIGLFAFKRGWRG